LALLDEDLRIARRSYREFVLAAPAEEDTDLCTEQGDESVTLRVMVESTA
jgi:hypothetical protein